LFFSEQTNRRHYSKSESLLVSLLKQEAVIEKNQQKHMKPNKILAAIQTQPIVAIQRDIQIEDAISIDSNNIQIKLENKDTDFIIKKQKIQKKTTNKAQVFIY
jgi:hypothetical protein